MDFLLAQDAPAQPGAPAQSQPAPAEGATEDRPGSGGWGFLVPILLMWLVIWFIVLRPQKRQEKERAKRVDALKKGDKVRTRGGIVATVLRVKEDEVILGLGGDRSVEVAIHKGYVEEVYPPPAKPGADAK